MKRLASGGWLFILRISGRHAPEEIGMSQYPAKQF
jgi:hypothetical protein